MLLLSPFYYLAQGQIYTNKKDSTKKATTVNNVLFVIYT